MKYFHFIILGLFCLSSFMSIASEQKSIQPGVVLQDTSVYLEPNRRSQVLYEIKEYSKVYIQQRHKSWYKVKSKDQESGWLRLLTVQYLGEPRQTMLGELSQFSTDVFNVQRSGPVVTTGVRGIDEETFNSAVADYKSLEIILSKKVSKEAVIEFAKQENLVVKNIEIPDASSPQQEKNDD